MEKPLNQNTLVYTVQESAFLLKISTKAIYDLCRRGKLKHSRGLRHIRITHQALEQYLRETSR